jgi:hypothetical protein
MNIRLVFDILAAHNPAIALNTPDDNNKLETAAFAMLNMLGKAYFYQVGKSLTSDTKVNWKKVEGKYVLNKPYKLTPEVVSGVVRWMQATTLENIENRLRSSKEKMTESEVATDAVSLYRTQGFEASLHRLALLQARQIARDKAIKNGIIEALARAKKQAEYNADNYIQSIKGSQAMRNNAVQHYMPQAIVEQTRIMLSEVEPMIDSDAEVQAIQNTIVEKFDAEELGDSRQVKYLRSLLDIASTSAVLYRKPIFGDDIIPGSVLNLAPYYRYAGIRIVPEEGLKFSIAVCKLILHYVHARPSVVNTGANMFMPEPVRDDAEERERSEKQAKILAGVAKRRQRLVESPAKETTYDGKDDVSVPAKQKPQKMQKMQNMQNNEQGGWEQELEKLPVEPLDNAPAFVYKLVDYLAKEFSLPERDKNLLLKELDEIEFYKAINRREIVQELEISEEEKEAGEIEQGQLKQGDNFLNNFESYFESLTEEEKEQEIRRGGAQASQVEAEEVHIEDIFAEDKEEDDDDDIDGYKYY